MSSKAKKSSSSEITKRRLTSEAEKLLHSLTVHRQVYSGKSRQLPKGTTHRIEVSPDGTKVLVRKRFSAV